MKPDLLLMMRERAGLNQTTLAEQLDVTQSTISNIERGHRAPSLELLESWALACGYKVVVVPQQLAEHLGDEGPVGDSPAQVQAAALSESVAPEPIDLRALRSRAGLTQRELAEVLGVVASYVGKLERGEREIDLSLAQRWARACGQEIGLLGNGRVEAAGG